MKKNFIFSIVVFLIFSCEKSIVTQNKQIISDIKTNTTFSSDIIYHISNNPKINKGVILTIESGAILLNNQGDIVGPETFTIEKDGKIVAEQSRQLHF